MWFSFENILYIFKHLIDYWFMVTVVSDINSVIFARYYHHQHTNIVVWEENSLTIFFCVCSMFFLFLMTMMNFDTPNVNWIREYRSHTHTNIYHHHHHHYYGCPSNVVFYLLNQNWLFLFVDNWYQNQMINVMFD